MRMTDDSANDLANKIVRQLPDAPEWALTVAAIAFVKVARATNTSDDGAVAVLRKTLEATSTRKSRSRILRP